MSKWIRFSDRLPEEGIWVFIHRIHYVGTGESEIENTVWSLAHGEGLYIVMDSTVVCSRKMPKKDWSEWCWFPVPTEIEEPTT